MAAIGTSAIETVFNKVTIAVVVYGLVVAVLFIMATTIGGDFVVLFNATMQLTKFGILLLPVIATIVMCEVSNGIAPFFLGLLEALISIVTLNTIVVDFPAWYIDTTTIVNLILTTADSLTPHLSAT